jgi:F0F1-type ATP synthase assembly protein I
MQQSTTMLVVRVALAFSFAVAIMVGGVALDAMAGTSPAATLAFLGLGMIFGTVMIVITIFSSFPAPPSGDGQEAEDGRKTGE